MTLSLLDWLVLPFVAAWLLVQFVGYPFFVAYCAATLMLAHWLAGARSPPPPARLLRLMLRDRPDSLSLWWRRDGVEIGDVRWCPTAFPPIKRVRR